LRHSSIGRVDESPLNHPSNLTVIFQADVCFDSDSELLCEDRWPDDDAITHSQSVPRTRHTQVRLLLFVSTEAKNEERISLEAANSGV
jgi:hypothetical protein